MTKKSRKKIQTLFLAQNSLKQIMSQLLDYTKKSTKKSIFYFGSELSEANNQHLQLTRQLILHIFPAQKLRFTSHFRKTNRKLFLAQNCLHRIRLTKNQEKKFDNFFWLRIV